MIGGFVNDDLEPVIEIELIAGDGLERIFAIKDYSNYLICRKQK